MITGIEFNNDIFYKIDENNIICPTTENLIIICDSSETKDIISDEIENLNSELGSDYSSSDDNEVEIKTVIRYKPTSIYNINQGEQKITITTENPFVLTAREINDIWFACKNKENKIEIYPFFAFKGYKETWESGIDRVYKDVCAGRYGDFGIYGR